MYKTALVVLSFNGLDTTRVFFDHFEKYTNTDLCHLIMIDNGSSDDTPSFLKEKNKHIDNMTLQFNLKNEGVIGGRNQGLDIYLNMKNRPDFFMMLDNDQFVGKNWLDQYHQFRENKNADLVGADAWLMNQWFFPCRQCKKPSDPYSYLGAGGLMGHGSLFEEHGLFDTQFNPAYFEDPDFSFRMRDKNKILAWNYDAKITHLSHSTLGNDPKKKKYFESSYFKFKKKWKGRRFNPLIEMRRSRR